MFKVNGTDIWLTRGDTFVAQIEIKRNNTTYTPVSTDTIRFALKHSAMKLDKTDYIDENPVLVKDIPYDTLVLQLVPTDTKTLGFGTYDYDIQITFTDGTVDTFISGTMVIMKEVA